MNLILNPCLYSGHLNDYLLLNTLSFVYFIVNYSLRRLFFFYSSISPYKHLCATTCCVFVFSWRYISKRFENAL